MENCRFCGGLHVPGARCFHSPRSLTFSATGLEAGRSPDGSVSLALRAVDSGGEALAIVARMSPLEVARLVSGLAGELAVSLGGAPAAPEDSGLLAVCGRCGGSGVDPVLEGQAPCGKCGGANGSTSGVPL